MRRTKNIFLPFVAVLALLLTGCDKINNQSLPTYTVHINLGDYGKWNIYGVHSLGEYRIFNIVKRLPTNFPYDVNTYTGFGGVLLFMGQDMATLTPVPLAFDLACPVEHNADVTVTIDPTSLDAVCPKCDSHFDVLIGAGGPKSGMAVSRKVGLNMYRVRPTSSGGYIITNY